MLGRLDTSKMLHNDCLYLGKFNDKFQCRLGVSYYLMVKVVAGLYYLAIELACMVT